MFDIGWLWQGITSVAHAAHAVMTSHTVCDVYALHA